MMFIDKEIAMPRKPKPDTPTSIPPSGLPETWKLRLYVAGMTPLAIAAFDNLKKLCEEHLPGLYEIEIVDLLENPRLGRDDQIVAVPTLVRKMPPPMKKIIGDLANEVRVLVGLDVLPR